MACDSDWTIRFLIDDGNFEVRPISMSMKTSRHEYDFCRAKLPSEVGEMMKPHTRFSSGKLYGLTKALVLHNDRPIHYFVFRPDWVDYGSEFTHLKLKDLHKALNNTVIDEKRGSVNLVDIYTQIKNKASDRFVTEIDFSVPDESIRTVYGNVGVSNLSDDSLQYNPTQLIERDDTKRAIESKYAIDFDEISPEMALRRLNSKFQVKSWFNSEGTLVVGLPSAKGIRHLAAPNDDRVWRYKDPSISHGREPVKKVIVEGSWVDEPGVDFSDALNWFDDGGMADVKAMGIAERTDIEYGSRFTVKATKAKRDALPIIAKLALKERMKQQNMGTIEIDPALSGEEVSSVIDVEPGDLIQLVPNDEFFEDPTAESGVVGDSPDYPDKVCGDFINNEVYLISEVEHSVTEAGDWQVHLDMGMYPDVEINSFMSYFDPNNDEWVDNSEIGDDGDLAGGIFEFESI
jgi:hypothetical protein